MIKLQFMAWEIPPHYPHSIKSIFLNGKINAEASEEPLNLCKTLNQPANPN